MSGEWLKQSILDLITTYKEHENLYDAKHKLYYNKQARSKSIDKILEAVKKTKPDITINDVVKKIQTLRTQLGQEISKIEKSKSLGEELIYVPKIWWFKHLSFLSKYMKMRSDPSTPLSTKLEHQKETSRDEEEPILLEIENFEDDSVSQSESKKRRIEFSPNIINSGVSQTSDMSRTIEYIINEETSELIPHEPMSSATDDSKSYKDSRKFKRKSKAFGKYVGCLMRDLNDEKLFFEAQNEILKIIEKTQLKMVQNKN